MGLSAFHQELQACCIALAPKVLQRRVILWCMVSTFTNGEHRRQVLSHAVRLRRAELGISQAELAKQSGLGIQKVGDVERGVDSYLYTFACQAQG
jgi:DNA-binding XRE family transcriptional regulator